MRLLNVPVWDQVIEGCIQKLGPNGILCLTGVGHGGHMTKAGTADMAASAVLRNTVIVGSVNANKRQWFRAGQTFIPPLNHCACFRSRCRPLSYVLRDLCAGQAQYPVWTQFLNTAFNHLSHTGTFNDRIRFKIRSTQRWLSWPRLPFTRSGLRPEFRSTWISCTPHILARLPGKLFRTGHEHPVGLPK